MISLKKICGEMFDKGQVFQGVGYEGGVLDERLTITLGGGEKGTQIKTRKELVRARIRIGFAERRVWASV